MKKNLQKLTALLLSLLLALSCTISIFGAENINIDNIDTNINLSNIKVDDIDEIVIPNLKTEDINTNTTTTVDASKIEKTAAYLLKNTSNPTTGTYAGDWSVIALMSAKNAGLTVKANDSWLKLYGINVKNDMTKALHYPSDYARAILGLSSAGIDATKIGGTNLVEKLTSSMEDISYNENNSIYTLLALDCKNYYIPNENVTREKIIDAIISFQADDGSFASYGGIYIDTTAMAIQALAPYYTKEKPISDDIYSKIKTSVDNALNYIKTKQGVSGGFNPNSNITDKFDSTCSTAQAIIALCSLNINPLTESEYIKDGKTMYDALMANYNDKTNAIQDQAWSADYTTITGLSDNAMATDQGLIALDALYRIQNNLDSVYNFKNVQALNIVDATKISARKSAITITGVGKTATISLNKTPTNTNAPISYVSSNKKIAIVSNTGKITAKAVGKANITINAKNIYGKNLTTKVSVAVKLAKPTNVKATAGKKKVTISFKRVTGAKKYQIYKKSGSKFKLLKTVSGTKYIDKKVKRGKKYTYKVRAVSGVNKSDFSKTVTSKKVKK